MAGSINPFPSVSSQADRGHPRDLKLDLELTLRPWAAGSEPQVQKVTCLNLNNRVRRCDVKIPVQTYIKCKVLFDHWRFVK